MNEDPIVVVVPLAEPVVVSVDGEQVFPAPSLVDMVDGGSAASVFGGTIAVDGGDA